jgi:esterase/lipase superfamily enzyme/TRAP-type C4-dicarboxylate transport system substrate-binding protein
MLQRAITGLITWVCIGSCAYAAEPVVIRLQVTYPAQSSVARGAEAFRSAVNERLGAAGRVELVREPMNPLEALRSGKADLAAVPTGSLVSMKSQKFTLFDLPFFFNNLDEVAAVESGATGDGLLASLGEEKFVGLGFWNIGMTQLFDRDKRIRTAEDLKGIALATFVSEQSLASTEGLQAQTKVTLLTISEIGPALANDRVQVAEILPSFVAQQAPKEITPMNVVEANYRPLVSVVATTRDAWKKWSFQVQSVIAEEVKAAASKITADAVQQDAVALSDLKARGFTPVALSPSAFQSFRALAQPGWALDILEDILEVALQAVREFRTAITPPQRRTFIPTTPIEVLFATDRVYDSSLDARYRFGSERDTALNNTARFGAATFTPDPSRSVAEGPGQATRFDTQVFKSRDEFLAELASQLQKAKEKDVLMYVHGYANKFVDAVTTAALLVSDSEFQGVPIVFSWPSEGNWAGYFGDEEEVRLSRDAFADLIRLTKRIEGLKSLHLLSHSMGGRLAVEWLDAPQVQSQPVFHHLVFAAPDVFTTEFDRVASKLRNLSDVITLYASQRDRSLWCSMRIHSGHRRAGMTGPDIVVRTWMDTIDVTNADPPTGALTPCVGNHSYITRNRDVVGDFRQLITLDLPPARRDNLHPQPHGNLQYWILSP